VVKESGASFESMSEGVLKNLEQMYSELYIKLRDVPAGDRAAEALGRIRTALRDVYDDGLAVATTTKKTAGATIDWNKELQQTRNIFQLLGISASSTLGRIAGGVSSLMASLQNLTAMKGGGFSFSNLFKGGLSNVVGNITSALSLGSAALSIGMAVFGVFH